MAVNSYKQDEHSTDVGKMKTLMRLFAYLLDYKKEILAVLAIIPSIIYAIAGVYLPFTASSLLIAVSVAMETVRQLESQMLMRHYKGFLK